MKNDRSVGYRSMRGRRIARRFGVLGIGLVIGCAAGPVRAPRCAVGALAETDLAAFRATHPLADGQDLRADAVARQAGGSQHVVQVATRERPHVHAGHDLLVVMLAGRGVLHLAGREVPMQAGDVVTIARGTPHWFAREGAEVAVALATFMPPLDAPDVVPVAE